MLSAYWLAAALAVHLAATGLLLIRRRADFALVLFALALPLVGPIAGWVLLGGGQRGAPEGEWMTRAQLGRPVHGRNGAQAVRAVPAEEALFLGEPAQRRALLLDMLKGDPRKHLDVLLAARFNEDPEIVHYATATLMALQRQMQMGLQRAQMMVEQRPDDEQALLDYAHLLGEYCNSGLMEGQLLRRRRVLLAGVLEACMARRVTPELMQKVIDNRLSLGQRALALKEARRMLARWPGDERGWLNAMRLCVEMNDAAGMKELLETAANAPVDWSGEGRQTMKYWTEKGL